MINLKARLYLTKFYKIPNILKSNKKKARNKFILIILSANFYEQISL